jgi:hypothetical protein
MRLHKLYGVLQVDSYGLYDFVGRERFSNNKEYSLKK